jgi:hypothetical protein
LGAFASADRRKSQEMMRYRVLFQLCTVGAAIGGIYYQAYKGSGLPPVLGADGKPAEPVPSVDKRVYMQSAARFDPPAQASGDGGGTEKELR